MNGKPITILLVEDDPAHAEIVRRDLDNARVANQLNWVDNWVEFEGPGCDGTFCFSSPLIEES